MKTTYFKLAGQSAPDIDDGWAVVRRTTEDSETCEDTLAIVDTETLADMVIEKLKENDPSQKFKEMTFLLKVSYDADEINDLDLMSGLSDMIQEASRPNHLNREQVLLDDLTQINQEDFVWESIGVYDDLLNMFMSLKATAEEIRKYLMQLGWFPADHNLLGRTKSELAEYYARSVFDPTRTIRRTKQEVYAIFEKLNTHFGLR